ncbi:MAG TPA: DNA-processing protein DprA, partial [Vicinamibacteria bacterium]|nr:DNA-processing protein DprA [Vicinamibacteria bacterium]
MLALAPGLPPRARAALLREVRLREVLRGQHEGEGLLPERTVAALRSGDLAREAERELAAAGRAGIAVMAWGEAGYPPLLAQTADPPPVLWVKGTLLPADFQACVAIVGSRQATGAGRAL